MPSNEQIYHDTLKRIAKGYDAPARLRKCAETEYGLSAFEVLEMAYENIQAEAAAATRGKRRPKE